MRILLLEDSTADAEMIRHALRQGGLSFDLERVQHRAEFAERLKQPPPDVILADFSLPDLDGYVALAIAAEACPSVPFIFVSGALGEEIAIETIRQGATDYVLKHRLVRLVPSIHRALREARQRADQLHAQEHLRQSHGQLRSLSVYLQYLREEERIRIAREVHDDLGQSLTGLKLELTWLTHRLPPKLKPLLAKTQTMAERIDETMNAIRRIAAELRPSLLDTAGLVAALEWAAVEFEKETGIKCRLHTAVREALWDQDLNTTFFRIYQEILNHIKLYAQASEVDVRFFKAAGHLVMEVANNGRGIPEEEIHRAKSVVLLSMRERAALLGGEVLWHGEAAQGTTVTVRVPHPPTPMRKPAFARFPRARPRSATNRPAAPPNPVGPSSLVARAASRGAA
jgi:signal transduction histidine kinase